MLKNISIYHNLIGKTLSKKDFFDKFPNFNPCKIVNSNMTHNDYSYKIGLNQIEKFIPSGKSSYGGLYLTDSTFIPLYLEYGNKIASIELPDDAIIYIEKNKIKVNKLIINDLFSYYYYFNKLDHDKKFNAVKLNPLVIKYISDPDKIILLEAVKNDPYVIKYILNPDLDIQLEAVKNDLYAIEYINKPLKEVYEYVSKYSSYYKQFV